MQKMRAFHTHQHQFIILEEQHGALAETYHIGLPVHLDKFWMRRRVSTMVGRIVVQVVGLIWKGTSFSVLNFNGSTIGMSFVVRRVGQAMLEPALHPIYGVPFSLFCELPSSDLFLAASLPIARCSSPQSYRHFQSLQQG